MTQDSLPVLEATSPPDPAEIQKLLSGIDEKLTVLIVLASEEGADLDTRFEKITNLFVGLQVQFAGINSQFIDLNDKLDRVNAQLSGLDTRLSRIGYQGETRQP